VPKQFVIDVDEGENEDWIKFLGPDVDSDGYPITPLRLSEEVKKGGPGSGFFGHAGRPGEVGGSASDGGGEGSGDADAPPPGIGPSTTYRKNLEKGGGRYKYNLRNAALVYANELKGLDWETIDKASDEQIAEWEKEASELGTKNFLEHIQDKPIAIRTPEEAALKILEEGRFKSQFETRKSGGLLDTKRRALAEEEMFNYPKDLPKEERPIYAFVQGGTNYQGPFIDQYGDVEWVLADSVKDRSTVTSDDSLTVNVNKSGWPTPIREPDDPSWMGPSAGFVVANDWSGAGLYIEAQIHGGLSTADVERVILHGDAANNQKLIARLDEVGIAYEVGR